MTSPELNLERLVAKENFCFYCRRLVSPSFGELSQEVVSHLKPMGGDFQKECGLCKGLFLEVPWFVELILKAVEPYQHETFLVGVVLDPEIKEKEEKIFKEVKEKTGKQPSTSLEKLLKTEIGKKIQEKTGKIVDFHRPDIMAILDTRYDDVRLQISSIYIYGRYRKLVRGIPQTVWHCRKCRGKGCRYCHFSGKMYETSVQELIAEPVLKVSGGIKTSFHGMGREDIDALMLGNGRPFVLEIKEPKKRVLDYEKLEKEVNKAHPGLVEILGLRSSSHEEVVKIKSSNYPKRYRVKVKCAQKVEEAKLKKAFQTLTGAVIEQRTPLRVKHRRADKVRKRKVLEIEGRILDDHTLEIEVKGESGLYIKELVHGDGGRTKPSLSELLENECEVETLDVIWIYDQE